MGSWFCVQVSDGWLLAYNAGEYAAYILWISPDKKKNRNVCDVNARAFVKSPAGPLVITQPSMGLNRRRNPIASIQRVLWQMEDQNNCFLRIRTAGGVCRRERECTGGNTDQALQGISGRAEACLVFIPSAASSNSTHCDGWVISGFHIC